MILAGGPTSHYGKWNGERKHRPKGSLHLL